MSEIRFVSTTGYFTNGEEWDMFPADITAEISCDGQGNVSATITKVVCLKGFHASGDLLEWIDKVELDVLEKEATKTYHEGQAT